MKKIQFKFGIIAAGSLLIWKFFSLTACTSTTATVTPPFEFNVQGKVTEVDTTRRQVFVDTGRSKSPDVVVTGMVVTNTILRGDSLYARVDSSLRTDEKPVDSLLIKKNKKK